MLKNIDKMTDRLIEAWGNSGVYICLGILLGFLGFLLAILVEVIGINGEVLAELGIYTAVAFCLLGIFVWAWNHGASKLWGQAHASSKIVGGIIALTMITGNPDAIKIILGGTALLFAILYFQKEG